MTCEWQHDDCKFEGTEKCNTCFSESFHYKPKKEVKIPQLKKRQNKADKRAGSNFEYRNYKRNKAVLNEDTVTCNMTLNSGATVLEKGDAHIRGLLNIMEEYKTKTVQKAPGKETFTIHREWLDKLESDFKRSGSFEFWDLRFSFRELDDKVYVILSQDEILSWIKTLETDRLKAKRADKKIELVNRKNEALKAEIALLRAQLAEFKTSEEMKTLEKSDHL